METTEQSESRPAADLRENKAELGAHELPTPRQYPEADVVIYDGKCIFCIAQVKNLLWFDGRHRLAFVSLHDPFVAAKFPDLTYEQMMEQIYIVPKSEVGYGPERFGGAAAIRYLTRRLPRLWIFAPLLHFPCSLPFWQWGYRLVAKRRYKIAGKRDDGPACDENGTCDLHFKD